MKIGKLYEIMSGSHMENAINPEYLPFREPTYLGRYTIAEHYKVG